MSRDEPADRLKQIQDCYSEMQKLITQMAVITDRANKDIKACQDQKTKYETQLAELLKV